MVLRIKALSAERQRSRHEQVFVSALWLLSFITRVLLVFSLYCISINHTISAQVLKDEMGFSTTQYAVYLDNKTASALTVVELAGRTYVEPIALAIALDCELRAEGTLTVLLLPSHVLAFAVDAHVVGVQAANSNTVSLTQMLHPVALQGGRVYLPFDDVLRLLADNGVYDVDEREVEVYLRSNGYSPSEQSASASKEISSEQVKETAPQKEASSKESLKETSKDIVKNDPSAEQKAPAAKPFRKPTRNLYILPNDVKRREMDSLPQKSSHLFFRGNQELFVPVPAKGWASALFLSRFLTQAVKKKPLVALATQSKSADKSKGADKDKSTGKPVQNAHSDNDFASAKKKWALDVIVLDAGHGGKDAGTIGFGQTKEKDVALGIVKKLGAMLKKELHGTKIVYTRTDDTFVELDRRGQIANENGGKLFISVHCNSTPKKPSKANGFEVYILRPGRNDDAVRVAEMENAVIKLEDNPKRYKPLTDEQFIVVSMAQSAFVKHSDMAAAMISGEVKRLHEVSSRGVKQAGFFVLVGASMPNVLIETGFLSNKKDEKFLKSERGQTQLASAICRAIKAYRARYEAQIRGQTKADNIPTTSAATEKKTVKSPSAIATKNFHTSSSSLSKKIPSSSPSKASKVSHK